MTNIIERLKLKFTSGNSSPVTRATITAQEFAELESRFNELTRNNVIMATRLQEQLETSGEFWRAPMEPDKGMVVAGSHAVFLAHAEAIKAYTAMRNNWLKRHK